MRLDQLVLEQRGFFVGVCDVSVDVDELALEPAHEGAQVTRPWLKIAPNAAPQTPRFSDVENLSIGPMKYVDARRGRELVELSLCCLGDHARPIPSGLPSIAPTLSGCESPAHR